MMENHSERPGVDNKEVLEYSVADSTLRDKLGEEYAEKARARLDEILLSHENLETRSSVQNISERATEAERVAERNVSTGNYEAELRSHLDRFEDQEAKSIDELDDVSKEEIVKALRNAKIDIDVEGLFDDSPPSGLLN